MLTELSIKDFAIIDEISITFKEGLTVLTGETGAGKSIIIDAVELLSGGRGSAEFVRYGANKASLEGLFTINDSTHPIYKIGKTYGIEIDVDGMVVLNRTISANGKSICRVNGNLVTLAILKEFGKTLIDIHSQHETKSLMDVERHIELLDLYDKERIDEARSDYKQLYKKLHTLKKRYEHLNNNEQEIAQRLDLLKFQSQELEQADLTPGEDDVLREEREKLMNYEKIYNGIRDAYEALSGEKRGLDWLGLALTGLETASEFEKDIEEKKESFSNHFFLIEELSYELRNYLETLAFDPERLNFLESRLNDINKLQKKYGTSVDEILEYAAKIEDEIEEIEDRDSSLKRLEQELQDIGQDTLIEARHLHDLRLEASKELKEEIHRELQDLYLEKAQFDVAIDTKKGKPNDPEINGVPVYLTQNGFDHVRFLISTNPGEPLKELNKIASGGELSRIMLALKNIFAKHQGVTSVIFDEVDTGVSGRVAQAIAEKIYGISIGSQVLCITHLPQVASMADSHLLIEKNITEDRTSTTVEELSSEERVTEIGRMVTGSELTETSKDHARELIILAEKFKG